MRRNDFGVILVFGCLIGALAVLFWVFFMTFISPGYVGVTVSLFGDAKGVDAKPLGVGAHVIAPWKRVYRFPVFEQNHCWEGSDGFQFQTKDGMIVFADIGITYRVKPDEVHEIFARYRRGIREITDVFLRNYIRDAINKAASRYKIEDLYSTEKERFFEDVQSEVRISLNEIGIDVSRIYLIGRFQFPDAVVAALNRKIEAVQRAEQRENELREAEAEARKVVATAKGRSESQLVEAQAEAQAVLLRAEAQATANQLLRESLTQELIMNNAIQAWDGKLPEVFSGEQMGMLIKK